MHKGFKKNFLMTLSALESSNDILLKYKTFDWQNAQFYYAYSKSCWEFTDQSVLRFHCNLSTTLLCALSFSL